MEAVSKINVKRFQDMKKFLLEKADTIEKGSYWTKAVKTFNIDLTPVEYRDLGTRKYMPVQYEAQEDSLDLEPYEKTRQLLAKISCGFKEHK